MLCWKLPGTLGYGVGDFWSRWDSSEKRKPGGWLLAVCDQVLPCSGGQENAVVVGAVSSTSLLIAAALSLLESMD